MATCRIRSTQIPVTANQRTSKPVLHALSKTAKDNGNHGRLRKTSITAVGNIKALSTETTEAAPPINFNRSLTTDAIVVIFKHDLRVEEHPGLRDALNSNEQIIPLYCLDTDLVYPILSMSGGVSLLWGGLQALKSSLMGMGTDLVFRTGRLSDVVLEVLEETRAGSIIMETEVDSKWKSEIDQIRSRAPSVIIKEWTSSDTTAVHSNGRKHKSGSLDSRTTETRPLPKELHIGTLPNLMDFQTLLMDAKMEGHNGHSAKLDVFGRNQTELWDEWSSILTSDSRACLRMLRLYLRRSKTDHDGTEGADILNQLVDQFEEDSFPGISFAPLFCPALSLGLLSPKQVRQEVQAAQGWVPWKTPFQEAAWRNSLSYDRCSDIHTDIVTNGCSGAPGNAEQQLWKWQAMTVEYSIIRSQQQKTKGIVVLVHGFGATCMHWRCNVDALCAAGYTVYCPTLPGYGRTQTLYMKYTQAVWKACLTAFLIEVIREPVVLAGNSIGAFVAAATAADHPDLVEALILLNPAGPLDADYVLRDVEEPTLNAKPPAIVVHAISRALLFYLSLSAGRILKSVYPVNTEKADAAFLEEILEASKDPNAIAVMKSVFFLNKPIPLNYLLKEMYQKPVLLLQGALDPLSDAEGKAHRIRDLCPNVQVELLEAGHCPHDETPELVNPRFLAFLHHLHTPKQS